MTSSEAKFLRKHSNSVLLFTQSTNTLLWFVKTAGGKYRLYSPTKDDLLKISTIKCSWVMSICVATKSVFQEKLIIEDYLFTEPCNRSEVTAYEQENNLVEQLLESTSVNIRNNIAVVYSLSSNPLSRPNLFNLLTKDPIFWKKSRTAILTDTEALSMEIELLTQLID